METDRCALGSVPWTARNILWTPPPTAARKIAAGSPSPPVGVRENRLLGDLAGDDRMRATLTPSPSRNDRATWNLLDWAERRWRIPPQPDLFTTGATASGWKGNVPSGRDGRSDAVWVALISQIPVRLFAAVLNTRRRRRPWRGSGKTVSLNVWTVCPAFSFTSNCRVGPNSSFSAPSEKKDREYTK